MQALGSLLLLVWKAGLLIVRPLGSRHQEGTRDLLAVTSGKDEEVKRQELVKEKLQKEKRRGLQVEF